MDIQEIEIEKGIEKGNIKSIADCEQSATAHAREHANGQPLDDLNDGKNTQRASKGTNKNTENPSKGTVSQENPKASEQTTPLTSPLLEEAKPPAKGKKTTPESEALQALCRKTWDFYATSHHDRYQTQPVRNQKVNSQIKMLCERLGKDAPPVAAYYVSLNDQWYTRNFHSLGLLLSNCEGIHTAWKTGQNMTSTQARQIENTQTNLNTAFEASRDFEDFKNNPYLFQPKNQNPPALGAMQ